MQTFVKRDIFQSYKKCCLLLNKEKFALNFYGKAFSDNYMRGCSIAAPKI